MFFFSLQGSILFWHELLPVASVLYVVNPENHKVKLFPRPDTGSHHAKLIQTQKQTGDANEQKFEGNTTL